MLHARANYFTVNYQLMDHNPCLDSPRRIGILRTYPILKSRLHSGSIDASSQNARKEKEREREGRERVGNVSKVSLSDGEREKVVGILPSGADSLDIYICTYMYILYGYVEEGRKRIGKWSAVTRAAGAIVRERQKHRGRAGQGAGNGEIPFIRRKPSV